VFKIKKAAAFLKAAAILSIAALTGCQATIENLLTAPKLTQEQSEIYQALINSSGSSIKLKYPRGGECGASGGSTAIRSSSSWATTVISSASGSWPANG